MKELENKLADLYKGAPALPKKAKDTIVEWWPYVVLVLGILQLWAALALWRYMDSFGKVSDFVNSLSQYYTNTRVGLTGAEKTVIYVGIAVLAVEAVLMLMAFVPLQKRQRRGWELLFLVSLFQVAYAVVSIFMYGYGVGSFIMNLIGAAIGFYFLFQIRDYYKAKTTAKAE